MRGNIKEYLRDIKISSKLVFTAECSGKRFKDIEYGDEFLGIKYGKNSSDVWNDIESVSTFYHSCLELKGAKIKNKLPIFQHIKEKESLEFEKAKRKSIEA